MNSFLRDITTTLERSPSVIETLLRALPESTIRATEGEGSWSAYDIVRHLIHGERTDWLPRLEIILRYGRLRPFEPFDREAQFREDQQRPMDLLLREFAELRKENLCRLAELVSSEEQLLLEGTHPAFGRVTARQLLATWAAHDLAHILQISRVLARRYRDDVGPWAEYMSVMK